MDSARTDKPSLRGHMGSRSFGISPVSTLCAILTFTGLVVSQGKQRKKRRQERVVNTNFWNVVIFSCLLLLKLLGRGVRVLDLFFLKVGSLLRENTYEPRAAEYFHQQLSFAFQRGNTCSVLGTMPHSRGLDEIYFVL